MLQRLIARNDSIAQIEQKLQPVSKGAVLDELSARNYLIEEFGESIKIIPAQQRVQIARLESVRRQSQNIPRSILESPVTSEEDVHYSGLAYFMAKTALYGAHHDIGARSIIEVASLPLEDQIKSRVSVLDSREDNAAFRSIYFTPENIDCANLFRRPTTTTIAVQGLHRYLHDFDAI